MQHYADDSDDNLVNDAVNAIGYCARVVPESTQQCLTALMSFIQSKHGMHQLHNLLIFTHRRIQICRRPCRKLRSRAQAACPNQASTTAATADFLRRIFTCLDYFAARVPDR